MAEYSSCTTHVPHCGTYFQNPQIYIINVPQCTTLFVVHIPPLKSQSQILFLFNTVVGPSFLYMLHCTILSPTLFHPSYTFSLTIYPLTFLLMLNSQPLLDLPSLPFHLHPHRTCLLQPLLSPSIITPI